VLPRAGSGNTGQYLYNTFTPPPIRAEPGSMGLTPPPP
jgi:hypothetical protein